MLHCCLRAAAVSRLQWQVAGAPASIRTICLRARRQPFKIRQRSARLLASRNTVASPDRLGCERIPRSQLSTPTSYGGEWRGDSVASVTLTCPLLLALHVNLMPTVFSQLIVLRLGPGRTLGCAGSTTGPEPGQTLRNRLRARTSFRYVNGMAWDLPFHPISTQRHAHGSRPIAAFTVLCATGWVCVAGGLPCFRPDGGRGIGRTSEPNRFPTWGRLPFFVLVDVVVVRLNSQPNVKSDHARARSSMNA